MRVALVRMTLAGRLAALEIAEAGHHVDLFGRAVEERTLGRIHMGYGVAGLLGSSQLGLLVRGVGALWPLLDRWTGRGLLEDHGSADILYALPQRTSLSVKAAQARFSDRSHRPAALAGPFRLGVEARGWRGLPQAEIAPTFEPSRIQAFYATREGAVDPGAIRAALDDACRCLPRIRQFGLRNQGHIPGLLRRDEAAPE